MPMHFIFFISSTMFLLGILVPSVGAPFFISVLVAMTGCALIIYYFGIRAYAVIPLLVIVGSMYFLGDDYRYHKNMFAAVGQHDARGVIASDPERGLNSQTFYVKRSDFSSGREQKILVRTDLYPFYSYGDELMIMGIIDAPPDDYYGRYLAKERVHGTMFYPKITRADTRKGSVLLSFLFRTKHKIKGSFERLLSYEHAAFLSGMTLAAREDFSEEFTQKLSLSGTMHLTAVSGLHMMILTTILLVALSFFMPKRYAFFVTVFVITGFTAMTGFKVSAIRAAIMGLLAGSAKEIVGRPHAAYNAIAFAALVMALLNPKVLAYDVGFQLSFTAAIFIIYFMPVLQQMARVGKEEGFLKWKSIAFVTVSAQLGVMPILIAQFQNFSLTSLAANVLALPAIPYIMGLGFAMGFIEMVWHPLTFLFRIVLVPLLAYVIAVIEVFSLVNVPFNPELPAFAIAIYYSALMFIMYRFYRPTLHAAMRVITNTTLWKGN